jgi:hypothetical protein
MVRWSEVIEAQRRWTDEIGRAGAGREWHQLGRPARLAVVYRRALASLGEWMVAWGCRLQSGYQTWTRMEESRFATGLNSDGLLAEKDSTPCG